MKIKVFVALLAAFVMLGEGDASARHRAEEYAQRIRAARMERESGEPSNQDEDFGQGESPPERTFEEVREKVNVSDEVEEGYQEGRAVSERSGRSDTSVPGVFSFLRDDESNTIESHPRIITNLHAMSPSKEEGVAVTRPALMGFTPTNLKGRDARAIEGYLRLSASQTVGVISESDAEPEKSEGLLAKYLRMAREKNDDTTHESYPGYSGTSLMRPLPVTREDGGGTLIFSDSPEYVKETGILYSDIVKGAARIFYYHLNDSPIPRKVAVILENTSGSTARVSISRRGLAGPDQNYLKVGKTTQASYFSPRQKRETIYLDPHMRRVMDRRMDEAIVHPGELVSGMYDFSASGDVRLSVLFYPVSADPVRFLDRAKILPRDEHELRGTFNDMNRVIRSLRAYDPTSDGIAYVTIGDNVTDEYIAGVDATDGSRVINYGNYGVVYSLRLPVKGKSRVMLSPLGGVYAGVVRSGEGKRARLFKTPSGKLFFGSDGGVADPFDEKGSRLLTSKAELADLGHYRADDDVSLDYSPPGASNLPVLIILAPSDEKRDVLSEEP